MPTDPHPTYAANFHCIGPACEDPCCSDWDIPLDRQTFKLYQLFPPQPLGALVQRFVTRSPGQPDELFAQINRTPAGSCPFYAPDHLCNIQKEYGPRALSATCSIYPRSLSRVDGVLEGSLSLSCPEAARQVLLTPNSTEIPGDLLSGGFRTDNVFLPASDKEHLGKVADTLLTLRAAILALLKDRSMPLTQRLLRVGALCHNLTNPSEVITDSLFDTIPANPVLRLEVVCALSESLVRDAVSPRFQHVFETFSKVLTTNSTSQPGDPLHRLQHAERQYYRPFFDQHPHILENYLINYVHQHLFPFGRKINANNRSGTFLNQYIQLCVQFLWNTTLLTGIAAHYQESFAAAHVIETIQAFTRAFEHYPETLAEVNTYLESRNLNTMMGIASILKS